MPLVRAADYPYQPYATQQPSTTVPTAYQDIRTPIGAFGGATGEALSQLGSTFEKASDRLATVALERQDLQNRIVADQQISSFENNINKVMYGDPDKPGDVGYMGLKGQAALDARGPTRVRIDQILQEHQAVLQNPHQRLAFDTQSRRYRNYVLNDVGRHYDSEFNRWGTEVTTGRAAVALGNAGIAANNDDFDGWKSAFGTGRAALQEGLAKLGHPQELVDAKLKDFDEKAVTDWAQKLATRDPVKADKFIDANREYLPGKYDDLKRQVKVQADKAMMTEIATGAKAPRGTPDLVRGGQPNLIRGGAVQDRVSQEAASMGYPVAAALATADVESSMGTSPDRPGSRYKGVFQMGNDEWESVGGGDRNDKDTQIRNGVRLQVKRKQELSQRLGRDVADWEVYLAHNQGVSGAASLIENPQMSAGAAVTRAGGAPVNISGNFQGNPNAPASQFVTKVRDDFNRRMDKYAGAVPAQDQVVAQAAAKGPDELLSNLPERDPNEIPDADLGTAYKQSLEAAAKRAIAAGAPISVWQGAVKMLRQQYTAAYIDQQRQEKLVLQEQHKKDETIKDQFLRRMDPDADNPPTVGEILRSDMSTAAKENTVGFLTARAQPGPTPRVSASNQTDLFARIHAGDEAEDKIRSADPINLAYKEKKITWEARKELINDFRDTYTSTKAEWAKAEADVLKAVKHTIRPSLMLPHGELIEQSQDPDGADREVRFKRFVDQQVKETVQAGKDPLKTVLNPDSPDYVGKQANRYTKAGPGLFNKVNEGAGKQSFAQPKSLSEVQAQFKSGRFGPPGSQEAQDAAFAEAVRLGFATPRTTTAAPVR